MENNPENRKIEIEQETLNDLNTTRKWTMFLAILGFIAIGLMVIVGLFAGVFLSIFRTADTSLGFPEWMVFLIVIIFIVIYFIPVLFLFRFSKYTATAVRTLDNNALRKAIKNLKAYYVFTGILVIIVLSVYLIAFIAAGASVAFLKNLGTSV